MQTASKVIDATVNSVDATERNKDFKLKVTISNRGDKPTPISIWLQPRSNDTDSQELLQWWNQDRNSNVTQQVELEARTTKTIELPLTVPSQVKAIVYHYDVWISAQNYPDLPSIRLPQQLQVRPTTDKEQKPDWEIVTIKKIEPHDPTRPQIVPATMRDKPHRIPPGESASVEVRVENRSGLVQRYTLTCDLLDDWYEIQYPNGGDALNLNPNVNHIGIIHLRLTPPTSARAGVYSPTIRLYSSNPQSDEDVQIDIIYFEIPPVPKLELKLKPDHHKIYRPGNGDHFTATITNAGNAPCQVKLSVTSLGPRSVPCRVESESPPDNWWKRLTLWRKRLFDRNFKSETVLDLDCNPSNPEPRDLTLVVKSPWLRFPRRKDQILPFALTAVATTTKTSSPDEQTLEQTLSAEVVWVSSPARVWWLLLLLLLLALGGFAWWLWMMLKLPPSPKIEGFTASRTDNGENVLKSEIRLAFTVRNACNLGSLTLTSIDAKGERKSNRFAGTTIGAAVSLNSPLSSNKAKVEPCAEQAEENNPTKPVAETDRTQPKNKNNAPKPTTYLVETPPPNQKNETPSAPDTASLKKNIFKFENCTPVENESLNCTFKVENLPPANDYTFELQTFPTPATKPLKQFASKYMGQLGICRDRCERETDKPTDTEFTESVAIAPILPLQIHNLKADLRSTPGDRKTVSISWTLHNIKTLEKLHVIRTEATGKSEIYTYQYGNNNISGSSNPNTNIDCQFKSETQLDCTWTQLNQLAPGTYKYRIEVFSKQNPHEVADRQETQNTIAIAPPRLDLFAFVPGTYVGGETPIRFNFAIDNPRQIKTLIFQAISLKTSQTQELQRYDFKSDDEEFIPKELQGCQIVAQQNTPQLQCVNVPISRLPIGQYQFALIAISQQEGAAPMSLQSDTIVVRPPSVGGNSAGNAGNGRDRALAGIDFKINGKPVGENPTNFLFAIDPNGPPTVINLTWDIKGADDRNLQVSLSPLLDSADPQGSLQFALQGAPSQQLFTLQVINELGEVESRTAIIQTYPSASSSAPPPPPPQPDRSPNNPTQSTGLPLPPPPNRDKLRPLEVPPTLD